MLDFIRKIFTNSDQHRGRVTMPEGYYENAVTIVNAEPGDMVKIVPVGVFPMHHDGGHEVTQEHVQEMANNFKNAGTDLLFDYEHRSLWGDSKAAGWSDQVEAREDGLYCKMPNFTSSAQALIDDREYRYFSPVYVLEANSKSGESLGAKLISVGLTNTPYFDTEIDPIGNSESITKQNDMKLSKENLAKLGLDENATEEQVNQAIANSTFAEAEEESKNGKRKSNSSQNDTAGNDTEQSDLVNKVKTLEQKITDRDKADQEERAEALVNSAIDQGKIQPSDKEAWLTSAKVNYNGTKKIIDERKANSAMPGNVTVAENNADMKRNKTQQCADFLRAQMSKSE